MSFEQLDKLDVTYRKASKWVGEVGVDHKQVDLDHIASVQLKLTPDDWCSMCMCEGDNYMGPCCGNMGAMQDVLNSVFRAGGWVSASDFRFIADSCIDHEGFDDFESEEALETALVSGLEGLHPWAKVGVIWQAAQAVLYVGDNKELPIEVDVSTLEDAVTVAYKHIMLSRFKNLWRKDDDGGQSACNEVVDKSAALAALHTIYAELQKDKDTYTGYALRSKDGALGENFYGTCMYTDQSKAEETLRLWAENEKFEAGFWSVAPFLVTVSDGFKWE